MLRAIAVIAIGLLAYNANGQDVDKLIEKNIAAKGGKAHLEAVQAIRQQGAAHTMGMKLPLVIYSKRPDKMRSEVEMQGDVMVTAFDGETAWTHNPQAGAAQKLPADQLGRIREQADIDGVLIDYAEHGYTLELVGESEVKGTPAVKLKLTTESGEEMFYYLDADSYLEVKVEREVENPMMGGKVKVETFLSDYRTVDGVKMPFQLESLMNGQSFQHLIIEKIDVNPDLPDSLFTFPGEAN